MILPIISLVILTLVTLLIAAGGVLIPWRYRGGKWWLPIGFKMMLPAAVWPMTWIGSLCAAGGMLLAGLFWRAGWPVATVLALLVSLSAAGTALASLRYILRVTAPHTGFTQAFGPDWQARLASDLLSQMLKRRWSPARYPDRPVRLERSVLIWTIPEAERRLLADLWLPPEGVRPSGVAYLYFHGSAWHVGDKGMGTDPLLRHLAAQGHAVLDVAYRLAPETDIRGMVHDVKRSIAWIKQNGPRFGVDPDRVVVGGGSAGGHISLLAAYGGDHPEFSPEDLAGLDTTVAGVTSFYGPVDMRAFVEHEAGRLISTGKRATEKRPIDFTDPDAGPNFNTEQMMFNLLGGMPDEVPAMYDLATVATHLKPGRGPAALLVQGEVDFITQTAATRRLAALLSETGIPAVYLEFPQTDHAWDVATAMGEATGAKLPLLRSQYAPPTTAMLYDLERFLAFLAA